MSASKLISLALLCVVLQGCKSTQPQEGPADVCTFWQKLHHPSPPGSIVFDRRTFQDSKLLFATCHPSPLGSNCTLVRNKNENFQGGNYTCSVDVKLSMRGGVLGEKFRVVPLADDRAVLAWLERTNTETRLGLTSVKFSDCSSSEVRVNVDHSFDDHSVLDDLHFLTYGNSQYDVFYGNSRECGDKYCKMNVDTETSQVSQPIPSFPIDRNNKIVDLKAIGEAGGGAVALEANSNECRFSILQDNAKRVLKVYGISGPTSVASSTSNDLIATCHLSSGTLNCTQYDQSGRTMVESANQQQANFRVLAIHNLRGGTGLFVLLKSNAEDQAYVLRLDLRGRPVGRIDVDKFECDQNLNAVAGNFWEKDNQYCASLACYETDEVSARKTDGGHLDATAKCFYLGNLQPVS